MKRAVLTLVLPVLCASQVLAQLPPDCSAVYDRALALYDDGRLNECLVQLKMLDNGCVINAQERDRALQLRAVTELRLDSIAALHRSLEQMLRNQRHPSISPGDAMVSDHYAVWTSYDEVVRQRFKKDQGRSRAGVFVTGQRSAPEVGAQIIILEGDEPLDYRGGTDLAAGAAFEWDMVPNLAVRIVGKYEQLSYSASSPTRSYSEGLDLFGLSLGLKQMFWLRRTPWVPYALVHFERGAILGARADIERQGDGLRYLPTRSIERIDQREQVQLWAGGGIGLGRKVQSLVFYAEVSFNLALRDLTLPGLTYVESELLTNYYFVDAPVRLHKYGLTAGVQYVLKYHGKNRFYP